MIKALIIVAVVAFAWFTHFHHPDANHGYTAKERRELSALIERESVPVSLRQRQVAATVYLYSASGERF